MGKLSFGTTGLSYQVNRVNIAGGGGAPKCPRCSECVYFNEEKKALGKSWHSKCFTCAKCKKNLDSTNANGHEGEIYCTTCHRREFGPKGYGFAGGASGLSTETCVRDILHGRSRSTSSTSSSSSGPKSPTIQQIQINGHLNHQTSNGKKSAPLIDRENLECCPRCGRRVYFAEEVKAMKRKWHKACFKCAVCQKMLDAARFSSHQCEVYCNSCYGRNFGPKGYGYGVGAGTLSSEVDPHKFYKSVRPRVRSSSSSTSPTNPTFHQTSTSQEHLAEPNGIRSYYNGASKEWIEHQEDVQYMKKIAQELDQFEYANY